MATKKKSNPYKKSNLVQFRVDNDELLELTTKASLYTKSPGFPKGNLSEFVREAALNYKPIKKVKVSK